MATSENNDAAVVSVSGARQVKWPFPLTREAFDDIRSALVAGEESRANDLIEGLQQNVESLRPALLTVSQRLVEIVRRSAAAQLADAAKAAQGPRCPKPTVIEDYRRVHALASTGAIEAARSEAAAVLSKLDGRPEKSRSAGRALIERIGAISGVSLLAPDVTATASASAAPEHARNRGKALVEDEVYPRTADPAHAVQQMRVDPNRIPSGFSEAQFAEAIDEWAHLFSDPPGIRRAAKDATVLLSTDVAKARIEEWKRSAQAQARTHGPDNAQRIILSLFDYTGQWSQPYVDAGYQVLRFDIQHGQDINDFCVEYFVENYDICDVYGILAACPCTDFAISGARHFAAKDADGRTETSKELVFQTLRTVEYFRPKFWVIENPVSRIERLTGLPKARFSFDPCHFGSPYTKKTMLWGVFNENIPLAPVDPVEGSKMHRLYGGKSVATKNARSETPEGFAYAFFQANNFVDACPQARTVADYPEAAGAIKTAFIAGMSEAEIREVLYNTYENGEAEEARNQLAEAVGLRAPDGPSPEHMDIAGRASEHEQMAMF